MLRPSRRSFLFPMRPLAALPGRAGLALILVTLILFGSSVACTSGEGDSGTDDAESAALDPNAPPPGRLPDGVRPTAYRLDLTIDPRTDDFGGTAEIDIELDQASDRIWLHGKALTVSAVDAVLPDGKEVSGEYSEELPTGVAALRFAEALPAGQVTLKLAYRADFDRNLAGLFKVEKQGDAYVLAKSESIQARSYLPGFDEPGLKATFDVRLTIPEDHVAICNAPEESSQAAAEGFKTVTFATTPPMPTYLLSLAVGPFDVVEHEAIAPNSFRSHPIPLRGFARRGRADELGYILDITPRMVEIFETELQRPYPFRKLDIVAAPSWPSGATELSGAITYREPLILVGDDPPPGARRGLINVHAHEIAHMWFGNLVTPPWWDDLWLKEGFATWASPLVLGLFEPDGGHEIDGAAQAISAMDLDSLASTRAIREPIDKNETIRSAYDAITYSKSLGVIHMVDRYFGADRFRPALGRYIQTFEGGVADSDQFYRVIGEETRTPELTETFRSFVEQKGVPQLEVDVACDDAQRASVTLTQRRYAALGSPIEDDGKIWNVPVCLRTDAGDRHCAMLTERAQTFPLDSACPEWILPNAGDGYYRWNLTAERWQALIDHFGELSPVEALYVVDSAFAAFESGAGSGMTNGDLLKLVEKTTEADARRVVSAPLSHLKKYLQHLPGGVNNDGPQVFDSFFTGLYRPVLERTADSGDADQRLLHRDVLEFLAISVQDPDTRRELVERAHAFTGFGVPRDAEALDSDLYSPALIVAVQDSDESFLEHLAAFRDEVDDPRLGGASANAIGRATNPQLLDKVHELALSDSMGPRDAMRTFAHMTVEPAVRQQNWIWLEENFEQVVAKMPAQGRHLLPNLGDSFCSEAELADLRRLFEEHGDLAPGYEQRLAQVEESIGLCIALRERGASLLEAAAGAASTSG